MAAIVVPQFAQAAPVIRTYTQTLIPPVGSPAAYPMQLSIDLNQDSIDDVTVYHDPGYAFGTAVKSSSDRVVGLNGTKILLNGADAASFAPGQMVGAAGVLSDANASVRIISTATQLMGYTPPALGNSDFLTADESIAGIYAIGVQIPVAGQNYYAWVGVTSTNNSADAGRNKLILHGIGYETSAGTSVAAQAPEPGSLALLVVVTVPLLARRRVK